MTARPKSTRGTILAAAAVVVALGGCAADGVEFNGKIFEAVGLSGAIGKREEPKTQARAPLVLPPEGTRLPEPGSAAPPVPALAADQAWPRDPQQQKIADAEAKKKAQEQHCRDGNWKEKALKDDLKASQGPQGGCGLFSMFGSLFGNSE